MKTLKDQELNAYYDAMFDLFAHPGWKLFTEDTERYLVAREDIRQATPETLPFIRGEISALDWVLGHKKALEHAYELMLEQEAAE